MIRLAVVGSQDVDPGEWLDDAEVVEVKTTDRTVRGTAGTFNGVEMFVLSRNNDIYPRPPHEIDYRANIEALVRLGVRDVISTSLAGSARLALPVGSLVILDQFIDVTRDRQFTYFRDHEEFGFADMTDPFCPDLRHALQLAARTASIDVAPGGCSVCVPGPRFETRAEVQMYGRLGGDLI